MEWILSSLLLIAVKYLDHKERLGGLRPALRRVVFAFATIAAVSVAVVVAAAVVVTDCYLCLPLSPPPPPLLSSLPPPSSLLSSPPPPLPLSSLLPPVGGLTNLSRETVRRRGQSPTCVSK